jgi:hypothetical protein
VRYTLSPYIKQIRFVFKGLTCPFYREDVRLFKKTPTALKTNTLSAYVSSVFLIIQALRPIFLLHFRVRTEERHITSGTMRIAFIRRKCRWAVVAQSVIATCYLLDGPGSDTGGDEIFRNRPDRPWGPHSLLYNG